MRESKVVVRAKSSCNSATIEHPGMKGDAGGPYPTCGTLSLGGVSVKSRGTVSGSGGPPLLCVTAAVCDALALLQQVVPPLAFGKQLVIGRCLLLNCHH